MWEINEFTEFTESLHDSGTAQIQARLDPLSDIRGSVMYGKI